MSYHGKPDHLFEKKTGAVRFLNFKLHAEPGGNPLSKIIVLHSYIL